MRSIKSMISVRQFLEDGGCQKKLPKDIREKLEGQTIEVEFSSYPIFEVDEDGKYIGCAKFVAEVKSPKTYEDLIGPYVANTYMLYEFIDGGKKGSECLNYNHHICDLWVEFIDIDIENNTAHLCIGS